MTKGFQLLLPTLMIELSQKRNGRATGEQCSCRKNSGEECGDGGKSNSIINSLFNRTCTKEEKLLIKIKTKHHSLQKITLQGFYFNEF